MSLTVDLLAIAIGLIVFHLLQRYFILTSGERKTNVPFIKKFDLIFGSKDIIFTNNKVFALNAHDRHKELGDTFGCYFGCQMQIVTKDADLIYHVCVNEFQRHRNRFKGKSLSSGMEASLLEARDDKWQKSRRAVGSVLKASKLKMDRVEIEIDESCTRLSKTLDRIIAEAKGDDAKVDVYQVNKNFVMQTILTTIFNDKSMVDFDSNENDVVEQMYNFINVNYELVARICFLVPTLTEIIRPLIGLFEHGHYLGLLLQKLEAIVIKARDEDIKGSAPPTKLTTIHSLIKSHLSGELSRDQLMGNAIFLMLAGFATTVDVMSALFWELASNQNVQDKLRADVMQYGEDSKVLEQCINETLRLYPGAVTNREMGEHIQWNNFRLVKGSCLNFNIYSLQRDPKYWGPDAEQWKPERFTAENVAKMHPAQFIPFGIGPRNCVGYNLAKLELHKMATAMIMRYKYELCPESPKSLPSVPLGTLPYAVPIKGPVWLKISKAI